jgi:diguanylate cyclase (GGDEF)-like protein
MIDLDHFKQVNDTHGHPGGDVVLKGAADAIVRVFTRRSDFVARYGGEEFAVIVVDVEPADLEPLCSRLLKAVRALRIDYRECEIALTCSIGAASFRADDNVEAFLQRADQALYQAKQSGRDRAVINPGSAGVRD